jgi:hypothetical protein
MSVVEALPCASVITVAGVIVPRVVVKATETPETAVPSARVKVAETVVFSLCASDTFVMEAEPVVAVPIEFTGVRS